MHLVSLGIGGPYPSFYSNTTCLVLDASGSVLFILRSPAAASFATVPAVLRQAELPHEILESVQQSHFGSIDLQIEIKI